MEAQIEETAAKDNKIRELTPKQKQQLTEGSRQAWDELYGSHIEGKKKWQRAFAGSQILNLLLAGGCIYLGSQPKRVPFIGLIDAQTGHYVGSQELKEAPGVEEWKSIYKGQVEAFVRNWRTVSSDKSVRDAAYDGLFQSWTLPGSQAWNYLTGWYDKHDPNERYANGEVVTVRVTLLEPSGAYTWGVWWNETSTTSSRGSLTTKHHATLTFHPVDNDKAQIRVSELTEENTQQ